MEKGKRRKIGIYSGSFDPVHTGHQMVANFCSQWGPFDEVWLTVSRRNPLKVDSCVADDRQRLEMAHLAASGCRGVKVSDFEMSLPVPSYSYTTLCRLHESFPDCDFSLIIGSDNWLEFSNWRDPEKIVAEFGVVVFPRPGYDVNTPLPAGVVLLEETPMAMISSTFIRRAAAQGANLNGFVPAEVASYIEKEKLYLTKKND